MGRMSLIDKYNNLISKIESLLEELDCNNMDIKQCYVLQEIKNELKISLG